MFEFTSVFASFSVDDIDAARRFYGDVLGLDVGGGVSEDGVHMMNIRTGGSHVMVYAKGPMHNASSFTVLNLEVNDIHTTVQELVRRGIEMIQYDYMNQDELGISRGLGTGRGPDIAWFKDPAGNIVAVIQNNPS